MLDRPCGRSNSSKEGRKAHKTAQDELLLHAMKTCLEVRSDTLGVSRDAKSPRAAKLLAAMILREMKWFTNPLHRRLALCLPLVSAQNSPILGQRPHQCCTLESQPLGPLSRAGLDMVRVLSRATTWQHSPSGLVLFSRETGGTFLSVLEPEKHSFSHPPRQPSAPQPSCAAAQCIARWSAPQYPARARPLPPFMAPCDGEYGSL